MDSDKVIFTLGIVFGFIFLSTVGFMVVDIKKQNREANAVKFISEEDTKTKSLDAVKLYTPTGIRYVIKLEDNVYKEFTILEETK